MKGNYRYLFLLIVMVSMAALAGDGGEKSPWELYLKCQRELEKYDYAQLAKTSRQLQSAARKHHDRRNEGYAELYIGITQLFNGQAKQSVSHLEKARATGQQTGNDTLVALALNNLGIYEATNNLNLYLSQRYFLQSLEAAKRCGFERIEGSAYGNLSQLAVQQRDTAGIEYARKCYEYGKRAQNEHFQYTGATHLAEFYHMLGRDTTALRYLDEAQDINRRHDYKDSGVLYTLYATVLSELGHQSRAEQYARMAVEASEARHRLSLPDAYYAYARIYNKVGRYDESNQMLTRAIQACKDNSVFTAIVRIYELMAENYEHEGDQKRAIEYLRLARDSADSTNAVDRQHLINERQMMLSIVEKEQEAALREQQMAAQRQTIGYLGVVVALLLVLLGIVFHNSRRRNQLYKNIVRQHLEAIEREQKLNARIQRQEERLAQLQSSPPPQRKMADDKADRLYEAICRMMDEERVWANPQFTREQLIERLQTNHTYLAEVIKEKTGGNYAQLVNSYRINEAIRILSDRTRIDYPLKQLCTDLGFASQSTFSKLFQAATGISPSAYRKSLRDIE